MMDSPGLGDRYSVTRINTQVEKVRHTAANLMGPPIRSGYCRWMSRAIIQIRSKERVPQIRPLGGCGQGLIMVDKKVPNQLHLTRAHLHSNRVIEQAPAECFNNFSYIGVSLLFTWLHSVNLLSL